MKKKICRNLTINLIFVLQGLGGWPFAEIVVAGKPRGPGQMWRPRPHRVISFHVPVSRLQPGSVILPRRLLRQMNRHYHRTEKRRLGARQIVSAVGIEHRTVVLDFKEKIVHHASRQFEAPVSQQAENNKVTVPAIHFVKAPSRNNVLILEIEQACGLNRTHVRCPQLMDDLRQIGNLDLTVALHLSEFLGKFETCGKVDHRRGREFRVRNGATGTG